MTTPPRPPATPSVSTVARVATVWPPGSWRRGLGRRPRRAITCSGSCGLVIIGFGIHGFLSQAHDRPPGCGVFFEVWACCVDDVLVALWAGYYDWGWRSPSPCPVGAAVPAATGVAASGIVVAFSYPLLRHFGRRADNPSILPLDYPRNVAVVPALIRGGGAGRRLLRWLSVLWGIVGGRAPPPAGRRGWPSTGARCSDWGPWGRWAWLAPPWPGPACRLRIERARPGAAPDRPRHDDHRRAARRRRLEAVRAEPDGHLVRPATPATCRRPALRPPLRLGPAGRPWRTAPRAGDVQRCLAFARQHGLRRGRPSGRSQLRRLLDRPGPGHRRDPMNRCRCGAGPAARATVGAGARLIDVYTALNASGRVHPRPAPARRWASPGYPRRWPGRGGPAVRVDLRQPHRGRRW